ncbi:MAG TPA: heme ABC exporter ATP-binding protein CcmA [Gemmatimonadales bacterium]|jgi:heme exporter protein A|nr:heme ABC exporter ATP-binding protein CcmA [Gemmatimonadales bacterium]
MLWARDLSHAFGAIRALDGISFTLDRGQTLVIFGPNGAGKTTLLRVLAGLVRPARGAAGVEGGRRSIGWIGHQSQLYGHLTVAENMRFWGTLYDVPPRDLDHRQAELLARLGLEARAGQQVRTLSRGETQRAAIARALIHDPPVLLLDEPFTGLDRLAAEELGRLFGELAARGRATVLVTHDVEEGTELASEVAFMRAGRFLAYGPRAARDAATLTAAYREVVGGA